MGDENKFAVADAVELEKPKRREIIMPRWVLIAWCAVILTVFVNSLPFIFKAWAWEDLYFTLGLRSIGLLMYMMLGVIVMGIKDEHYFMIAFGIVLVPYTCMYFGAMYWTVATILLWGPIVLVLLIVQVFLLFRSGFAYHYSLVVLGLSILIGVAAVEFQRLLLRSYDVIASETIDNRSYHYITFRHEASKLARLYECTPLGYNCVQLYSSQDTFLYSADYTWEIDRGTDTRITLFVNGQAINEVVIDG